jgi:hypothetical protein
MPLPIRCWVALALGPPTSAVRIGLHRLERDELHRYAVDRRRDLGEVASLRARRNLDRRAARHIQRRMAHCERQELDWLVFTSADPFKPIRPVSMALVAKLSGRLPASRMIRP